MVAQRLRQGPAVMAQTISDSFVGMNTRGKIFTFDAISHVTISGNTAYFGAVSRRSLLLKEKRGTA
jgi:hypothetical protein